MVIGIILAAGASTRMGRAKALLPVGPDTFVTRLARSFVAAGIDDLVVVTGPERDAIDSALAASRIPARVVRNPRRDDGQLSSLLVGLALADTPGVVAVVVGLVDAPLVLPGTIRAVVEAYRRTRSPIVRPVSHGRHGHPVLFAREVFDELRHADSALGAKAVVRAHEQDRLDVPVDDDGAWADIDTPDDYARLIGSASGT
ncbi:MAG: nucleotidyltransferase family protein [Acidobacteria bacterium]|nr:nucleotidyltransferase family protein [Acidobacteriota bacterium]